MAAFRGWSERLPDWVELSVLQLPGRGSRFRDVCCHSLDEAARHAADDVAGLDDRPLAIFGHSLGALLGFEAARYLTHLGRPPVCLFTSARPAPALGDRNTPIAGLSDAEFVAEVLRRYDGIPAAVLQDPDLLALLLPSLRADIAMLEGYRYRAGAPLPCPIVSFGGDQDPHATVSELQSWSAETGGGHRVHVLPGGHFFLQTAAQALIAIVETELGALTFAGRGWSS